MLTFLGLFPTLPSAATIISDTSLYSGSIFDEFLPIVLTGVGITLAGMLVAFAGRTIIIAISFITEPHKTKKGWTAQDEENYQRKFYPEKHRFD